MARFLREQGYRAYALAGGLQGWYEAGYPLEAKTAEWAAPALLSARPAAAHWPPIRRRTRLLTGGDGP